MLTFSLLGRDKNVFVQVKLRRYLNDSLVIIDKKLEKFEEKGLMPVFTVELLDDQKRIDVSIKEIDGEKIDLSINIDAGCIKLWIDLKKELEKHVPRKEYRSMSKDKQKEIIEAFLKKINGDGKEQDNVEDIKKVLGNAYRISNSMEPMDQYIAIFSQKITSNRKEDQKNLIRKLY